MKKIFYIATLFVLGLGISSCGHKAEEGTYEDGTDPYLHEYIDETSLDSGMEADTDEMDGTYDPSGDDIPKDISQ